MDRHTPDRAGYLAYLRAFTPEVAEFFGCLPALPPENDRRMHSYVTGSSGSGKSTTQVDQSAMPGFVLRWNRLFAGSPAKLASGTPRMALMMHKCHATFPFKPCSLKKTDRLPPASLQALGAGSPLTRIGRLDEGKGEA